MSSQVVLITGASAGFGKVCAEHLSLHGHRVYGTSRRAEAPEPGGTDTGPRMIPMDVCDDDSVRAAVDLVLTREGRLDVVVNNAGVGVAGSVEDTLPEEALALFETNFFGVHRVCRAVLPALRRQGSGLIVNVSSLGGRMTLPFQGFYSASKYAVESLTEALRMELKPFGIRVTMIEPGDFKTDFTANRTFARASGDDSAYAERCRIAVSVMEKDELGGSDPKQVARLVARLMEKNSPRARYPIGSLPERVFVGLKRFLPDALFERGVSAYYKV
jgi:NAD(P)-dependent dehydrogenase (short-subunit alcohol dehydrogenase family)